MHTTLSFESMSDDALLAALDDAVGRGRRSDADIVAHIAAVDARRLYLGRGYSSMFGYATEVLRMSEGAAYTRIAAARAARKHPVLLEMLADGRLHLTGIARLAPHLTVDNCDAVLARAVHRSKRQIEELIAELAPKADVPAAIRKLPAPRAARAEPASGLFDNPSAPAVESTLAPAPAALTKPVASKVVPLAPARYKVQFTASAELTGKLERRERPALQRARRPRVPSPRPVRARRGSFERQHRPRVPQPQRLSRGARFRRRAHGPVSVTG
jgi:hypothetical protein